MVDVNEPPRIQRKLDRQWELLEEADINLEREPAESFADWIRAAVDKRFEMIGRPPVATGDESPRSRPTDYTPANDTPDEQVIAAVSPADPGDWIGVTVEFPASVLEAIDRERDPGDSFANWVRFVTRLRFALIDRELEQQPAVTVDVSAEVAERARLRAQYAVECTPEKDYHEALGDSLFELVQPQPVYYVDGEPIARVGVDGEPVDPDDRGE